MLVHALKSHQDTDNWQQIKTPGKKKGGEEEEDHKAEVRTQGHCASEAGRMVALDLGLFTSLYFNIDGGNP